jgi:hypothetical protein
MKNRETTDNIRRIAETDNNIFWNRGSFISAVNTHSKAIPILRLNDNPSSIPKKLSPITVENTVIMARPKTSPRT